MSELTTDKALRFIADGLCDCMGTLEEHHTNGCPQDEVAVAWLAQVQREAAVKTLREAARAFEAATINIQIFGNSHEAELVRVDNAARARFVESLRARADQIDELFTPGSLRAIWLTFSDPFPKKRSAGRRLTHPMYLKKYANLLCLRPGLMQSEWGGRYVKHDNQEFFEWSLEQLVTEGWRIDELSFDLHESELSDDYKTLTSYEQRWLEEGRTTQFVRAH